MDHQAALSLIQDIFRLKQKLSKSSKVKEKLRQPENRHAPFNFPFPILIIDKTLFTVLKLEFNFTGPNI